MTKPASELFDVKDGYCAKHENQPVIRLKGGTGPWVCTLCALEHLQKSINNDTTRQQTTQETK